MMKNTTKTIMEYFLESEEGKKFKQVAEESKNVSIEDKVKFVDKIKERSKHLESDDLLFEKGEKLKYFLYLDEVTEYKFEKYIEKELVSMKDELLYSKKINIPKDCYPHKYRK